jgi:hypothetical protein
MSHVKVQRIQRQNRVRMQMLAEILQPEVLHAAVPRLATAAEGRAEYQNIMAQQSALAKYTQAGGFDPTRTFQHVAKIESSVWSAILECFGKFDEKTGELADDGLLYKTDENGTIKLNRDFLIAIVEMLEASGYVCDMRGRKFLT